MSEINVLDASAILAYLHKERGETVVQKALDEAPCLVTSINYCEVLTKLSDRGVSDQEAQEICNELDLTLVDFDRDLAIRAAQLRARTREIGASLGDRACFALADRALVTQGIPSVYTTEILWTKIKWPFKVVVIRSPKNN